MAHVSDKMKAWEEGNPKPSGRSSMEHLTWLCHNCPNVTTIVPYKGQLWVVASSHNDDYPFKMVLARNFAMLCKFCFFVSLPCVFVFEL